MPEHAACSVEIPLFYRPRLDWSLHVPLECQCSEHLVRCIPISVPAHSTIKQWSKQLLDTRLRTTAHSMFHVLRSRSSTSFFLLADDMGSMSKTSAAWIVTAPVASASNCRWPGASASVVAFVSVVSANAANTAQNAHKMTSNSNGLPPYSAAMNPRKGTNRTRGWASLYGHAATSAKHESTDGATVNGCNSST